MKQVFSVVLAVLLLTACGSETEEQPVMQETVSAEQRAAAENLTGEALFEELCASCHPRSGRGDYLKKIPATLLTRRSEAELAEWIRGLDQHREMPSFEFLSEEQLASLAEYLQSEIAH